MCGRGVIKGWGTGVVTFRAARACIGDSSCVVTFFQSVKKVSALLLTGGVLAFLGIKGYILDLYFKVEEERVKKRRPFWT